MDTDFSIAIDAFRLISQPLTSGAFVVSELVRELSSETSIKRIILLMPEKPGDGFSFGDLLVNKKITMLYPEKPCSPQKNFRRTIHWMQVIIPALLKKELVTHFIAPYHQAPVFLDHKIKVITIIHDVCGILPSAGFSYAKKEPYRHWFNFNTAMIRSDFFVYVSEHTKKSFEKLFPNARHKKSWVIYPKPTVTPVSGKPAIEKLISTWRLSYKKYFFAFGAEGLRKGTDLTISAFTRYREQGGKNKLVLLISNASLRYFEDLVSSFSDSVLLISQISNAERDALYAGAIALVFPSRCEGFGYPILEAMCQGCPPIALHNSPAEEIIGGCIPSLSNLNVDEILKFMLEYENNTKERQQNLSARLVLRANSFIEQNHMVQKYISIFQPSRP